MWRSAVEKAPNFRLMGKPTELDGHILESHVSSAGAERYGVSGEIVEGLCGIVEGLCGIVEGLCSAHSAISAFAATL